MDKPYCALSIYNQIRQVMRTKLTDYIFIFTELLLVIPLLTHATRPNAQAPVVRATTVTDILTLSASTH